MVCLVQGSSPERSDCGQDKVYPTVFEVLQLVDGEAWPGGVRANEVIRVGCFQVFK